MFRKCCFVMLSIFLGVYGATPQVRNEFFFGFMCFVDCVYVVGCSLLFGCCKLKPIDTFCSPLVHNVLQYH